MNLYPLKMLCLESMISISLEKKIRRLAYASLDLINAQKQHFTFITRRNKIISFGYNRIFYTHPKSFKWGHRFNDIHSELSAINSFPYHLRELPEYNVINVRIRRLDNSLALARPCPFCTNMLQAFGVRKVLYTTNEGRWAELAL
jgi:tRNA(Arg) A34 adenosine deaminase TadA